MQPANLERFLWLTTQNMDFAKQGEVKECFRTARQYIHASLFSSMVEEKLIVITIQVTMFYKPGFGLF